MSIFDFPRFNVKGLLGIDVGTANNDDYSAARFPPDSPNAGEPLRLADSIQVQPNTFGMDDATFIRWIQEVHTFLQRKSPPSQPAPCKSEAVAPSLRSYMTRAEIVKEGGQSPGGPSVADSEEEVRYLPAEWNYYGSMGLDMRGVRVLAATEAPGTISEEHPAVGSLLSFKNRPGSTGRSTGMLIDVNPEDVPCSQIFTNALTLEKGGKALLSGKPSKAVTRWINFQRNTGLNGPNGAAGTFQSVVPLSELEDQPLVEELPAASPDGRPLRGVVFRYVIFRALQEINTFKYDEDEWFAKIRALYATGGRNPDIGEVVGTLAPWFEGDMRSAPTGRLLEPAAQPIYVGGGGNGPCFGLAPAVLRLDGVHRVVSVDLATSLFDAYDDPGYDPLRTGTNPKFDFGELRLMLESGGKTHDLGAISYQDTAAGDRRGWIFDLPFPEGVEDLPSLAADGLFCLLSSEHGKLLNEREYYLVSDQACLFGEEVPKPGSKTELFLNESGDPEPATIQVLRQGRRLSPAESPELTVWEYDTTPNQSPGPLRKVATGFRPGDALVVENEKPGNRLYTFTLPGEPDPPASYSDLSLMTTPQINLRLLPNGKDYGEFYEDPSAREPIGSAKLTFDVIYREVLRNYYLLYPAMNQRIPLNDVEYWADPQMARRLLMRTQRAWFDKAEYMPRTRDLSQSRRTLIAAWCRKIIRDGGEPPPA